MKRGKYLGGDNVSRDCTIYGPHLNERGELCAVILVDGRALLDVVHYTRVMTEEAIKQVYDLMVEVDED